ncbi:MAG: hypothetical protein PWQ10_653, partial [Patescibacteria group bacterium]|nr:hypothetical protein [Patescibacteria group bacterium]
MKQTSAFTLVEVVIVIVIIGIISTIGVFSYSGVQSDSRDTQRSSRVSVISEALEKYYWQNGNYPSCEELTQDASVVSSDVLKGIDATVLATPSNPNGTNSIVCDNNSNNVDAFIYSTPTDGSEYTLSYIKESTKEVVPLASRYSKLIVNLGVSVISIDSVSDTQINISWSAVEGATEYKVERSTSSDFNSNLVETSTSDLSMSNTGLSVGTMYYFHVIPKSTNGMGSSVAKEATTTIPAPSSLAVTTSSSTSTTTWSWTTVTCSAGTTASYQYRYTTSSGYDSTWVTPTSPTATSISFTTSTEG